MPLMPEFPGSSPAPILPGAPIPPPPPRGAQQPPPQVSLSSIRFQERSDYEKGFTEYFDEKIKPVIRGLEQERLMKLEEVEKLKPKGNLLVVIGIIIGIALTFYFKHGGWLFLIPVAFLIKSAMLSAPKEAVSRKYKESIVPLIVKYFGDFNYIQHSDPPEDTLRASGLFDGFNSATGEDYIEGNHKGTVFKFSEIHLVQRGNKSSHTVFNGMIILTDIKRAFAGQTVVRRESQKGIWASMTGKFKGMQKVPVQNPEFEKLYEVYSSDPNEATMLVNPDFVVRLMELNNAYPDSMVRCTFFGGKLLVAVNSVQARAPGKINALGSVLGYSGIIPGRLFETGSMDKSLADTEDIHNFMAQMHAILKIVETVNPPKEGYAEAS